MQNRPLIKGEQHHWWPKSISKYWGNEKGLVHRVDFCGNVISSTPKEFGKISNGHNILFEEDSPWQTTIEHYFDKPDRSMTKIVEWLTFLEKGVQSTDQEIEVNLG